MRKLIALLLSLLLIVNVVSFAGAYDEPGLTGGQLLKKYGFVQGNEKGELNEHKPLNRAELTALLARMYGVNDEARAYKAGSGFKDESKFGWAKGYIAYAKMKGWMKGEAGGNFNNFGQVSGEQLATVLLRVLNRPEKWGENIGRMGALGVVIPSGKLTRGQTFAAIWSVVSEPIMADGSTLGVNLGKLVPKQPDPIALGIAEIKTVGLRDIHVKFNQPIQDREPSVEVLGLPLGIEKRFPENDDKVVVLSLNKSMVNQKEYTLKIGRVYPKDTRTSPIVAWVEKKFTALDASMPVVESVRFSGTKHIEITFSEQMASPTTGKVEVKQGNTTLSVNNANARVSGNKVVVELFSVLTQGKDYTITVSDFKDFAGYSNKIETVNLAYGKDSSAPTVTRVSGNNEYVTIQFSKPVKGASLTNFAHSFPNYHPVLIQADGGAFNSNQFYDKLFVTFYQGNASDKPLPSGEVKFMVFGKSSGGTIVDAWGNALQDQTLTVTITGNNDPLAATIKALSGTQIEVEFSKAVKNLTSADFRIKKTNGSGIGFTVTKVSDKKYHLVLNQPVTSETLNVEILKAVDTTANASELKNYKVDIVFGDTEAPKIDSVVVVPVIQSAVEVARELVITFEKDDTSSDAIVGSNYKVTNGSLYYNLSGTGEFVGGSNIVKFVLPKSSTDAAMYALLAFNGTNALLADNIKDNAGNVMPTKSHIIQDSGSLDLYVDEAITFSDYNGTGRDGIVLFMTSGVREVKDINRITTSFATKFDSVEIVGNKVYLMASTDIPKYTDGTHTIDVPAGVIVSDLGRDNIADSGRGIIDGYAPDFARDSSDQSKIDVSNYLANWLVMDFSEPLDSPGNVNDLLTMAFKVTQTSGSTTKELVPYVDFRIELDLVRFNNADIKLLGAVANGDLFVIEWKGSEYLKDKALNKFKVAPGIYGQVEYNN